VGYGPGGRFVGRIGHIYVIRRRIGHIYMTRNVEHGIEDKTETEGEEETNATTTNHRK
jgi:hypothetical protein